MDERNKLYSIWVNTDRLKMRGNDDGYEHQGNKKKESE